MGVSGAKKALENAEAAAKLAVEACACDVKKKHDAAVAGVVQPDANAWKEAHFMNCVLAGTAAGNCQVPPVPKISVPALQAPASTVTAADCKKHEFKPLKCEVKSAESNNAGVVKPKSPAGSWSMLGGGMNNRYRTFDAKAGFEQAIPDGNTYSCDTGFGPGKVTCYAMFCQRDGKSLACHTSSARMQKSGTKTVNLP